MVGVRTEEQEMQLSVESAVADLQNSGRAPRGRSHHEVLQMISSWSAEVRHRAKTLLSAETVSLLVCVVSHSHNF